MYKPNPVAAIVDRMNKAKEERDADLWTRSLRQLNALACDPKYGDNAMDELNAIFTEIAKRAYYDIAKRVEIPRDITMRALLSHAVTELYMTVADLNCPWDPRDRKAATFDRYLRNKAMARIRAELHDEGVATRSGTRAQPLSLDAMQETIGDVSESVTDVLGGPSLGPEDQIVGLKYESSRAYASVLTDIRRHCKGQRIQETMLMAVALIRLGHEREFIYEVICNQFNITRNAARQRIFRGRKQLQEARQGRKEGSDERYD